MRRSRRARRFALVLSAGLLVLGPRGAVAGPAAPPPPDVAPLVAAEHAFARDVAARGIGAGFAAHMAAGAILFRPVPVEAQAWLAANPGDPVARLRWEPSHVEMSSGGDFGWTTGPWSFARAEGEAPVAHGHFTTVWRRQSDGAWKAEIDHGHRHPPGAPESLTWSRAGDAKPSPRAAPVAVRGRAEQELLAAERRFGQRVARDGYARALAAHAGADVRVGRDGSAPWRGREAAAQALGTRWKGRRTAWSVPGAGVAEAGDLGFTYGTVVPEGEERFAFLHVWRRSGGRTWRLVQDVTVAAPEPRPAPAGRAPGSSGGNGS